MPYFLLPAFTSNIADRFSRFALSNPQNAAKLVAAVTDETSRNINQRRKLLSSDEFSSFADSSLFVKTLQDENGYVQVYLRPAKGIDCTYVCQISFEKDKYAEVFQANPSESNSAISYSYSVVIEENDGSKSSPTTKSAETTSPVSKEIIESSRRIAEHFHDNLDMVIESASVRFIVDDNEHIWLSEITSCKVISTQNLPAVALETVPVNQKGDVAEDLSSVSSILTGSNVSTVNDKAKKKKKSIAPTANKPAAPQKKKSKLDEPPSMELIAKFAAERDRFGLYKPNFSNRKHFFYNC